MMSIDKATGQHMGYEEILKQLLYKGDITDWSCVLLMCLYCLEIITGYIKLYAPFLEMFQLFSWYLSPVTYSISLGISRRHLH